MNKYRRRQFLRLMFGAAGRREIMDGIGYRLWPLFSALAGLYRGTAGKKTRVTAVVGSNGKSTAVRAVVRALGAAVRTSPCATRWNMAEKMLRLRGARHAVIEAAIGRRGEMREYARMLRPDITVVTSIGSEHNRQLGSLAVTRAEKYEMVRALGRSGTAVLNGDDPNVLWMKGQTLAAVITFGFGEENDVRATDIVFDWPKGMKFNLHAEGRVFPISCGLIGRHMVYSVLAAVAVAIAEKLPLGETLHRLSGTIPVEGRLQPVPIANGAVVLRDDFKAPLESVHAALDVLAGITAQKKFVVMGDVSEMPGRPGAAYRKIRERIYEIAGGAVFLGGAHHHHSEGAAASGIAKDSVLGVSVNVIEAAEFLRGKLAPGDVVLIKGRRTQRLERISLLLQGDRVRCDRKHCDAMVISCADCHLR